MRILMFLLPGIGAAIVSFLLTPLTRVFAARVGAIDHPGPRKIHDRPIPRLGGLAVIASAIAIGALRFSVPARFGVSSSVFLGFGLGFLPILVVSFVDDVRGLRVAPRLAAQIAGAGIATAFGVRLGESIHLFGMDLRLGVLAVPLSILWIVGVTNAFNIVDGLDGLSAGLALISASSLVGVSLITGHTAMASVALILAGALLGFLPYNISPASVFLGDVGATAIGFCLACLALVGGSTLSAGMAVLVPIPVIGVPLAETAVSMMRRFLRRFDPESGAGVFQADREHIHHRLVAAGASQGRAVAILYGAALVGAICGLVSMFLTTQGAALLFVTLVAAVVIGVTRLNYDEFALVRRGVILKIYDAPVLKRALFPVFFDLVVVVLSAYLAIGLKYDDWALLAHRADAFRLLEMLPPISLVCFSAFHLYRGAWRNAGIADMLRTTWAVVTAGVIAAIATQWGDRPIALSLVAIDTLILLLLVNGSRASYRLLFHWKQKAGADGERVLIYGAGLGGSLALREILSNRAWRMRPAGFVDDDPDRMGRVVNGYRVLGTADDLDRILSEREVDGIIVSTDKIAREKLRHARSVAERRGVWVTRFSVGFGSFSPGRSGMTHAPAPKEAFD